MMKYASHGMGSLHIKETERKKKIPVTRLNTLKANKRGTFLTKSAKMVKKQSFPTLRLPPTRPVAPSDAEVRTASRYRGHPQAPPTSCYAACYWSGQLSVILVHLPYKSIFPKNEIDQPQAFKT